MSKRAQIDCPIHEHIADRWSPVGFSDRPVDPADLRSLFEAARWAPSSYNAQPWRYLVATADRREQFERMLACLVEGNQAWARHAPVLAIGLTAKNFEHNGKPNAAAEHDLGLASATLSFEATARGLKVHQMIGILRDKVRQSYGVPDDVLPLTALAIGYVGSPDGLDPDVLQRDHRPRERHKATQFVFAEAWGKTAGIIE